MQHKILALEENMYHKILRFSIVLSLVLGLGLSIAWQAGLFNTNMTNPVIDSGYPAVEGVDETIVEEMPVPGMSGNKESVVNSKMPVFGLEGIEEMIVNGK
jgi:hypothetical protein